MPSPKSYLLSRNSTLCNMISLYLTFAGKSQTDEITDFFFFKFQCFLFPKNIILFIFLHFKIQPSSQVLINAGPKAAYKCFWEATHTQRGRWKARFMD